MKAKKRRMTEEIMEAWPDLPETLKLYFLGCLLGYINRKMDERDKENVLRTLEIIKRRGR